MFGYTNDNNTPPQSKKSGSKVWFYQYSVEILNITSLAIFSYFFLQVSTKDGSKISDNLEDDMFFRVSSSIFIGYVYLMYILYFVRFREAKPYSMGAGIFLVIVSYAGWILLVSIYTTPYHLVGVGIFISGIVSYWIVVLVFHRIEFFNQHEQYMLLFATVCMGITYIILYYVYDPISWTFEYLAMILWHICNIVFFYYHDPNPENLITVQSPHEKYSHVPVEYQ